MNVCEGVCVRVYLCVCACEYMQVCAGMCICKCAW